MSVQTIADPEDLYRAAVGPRRADYYASKFLRFDQPGASRISWNWPAFIPLVSFFWFPYRRMYGYWAIFCLLIPVVMGLCFAIVAGEFGNSTIDWAVEAVGLAYGYLLIPMIANALYYRHIRDRVETVRRRVRDPAMQVAVLENGPHTSAIAWVIIALMLAIPLTGIMAAIAIPAYQMYTIRAQVSEGLMRSRSFEAAVVRRYQLTHRWPVSFADLGMSQPPSGRYVASIGLDRGTLSITYGNQANRLIAGHTLSLRPTILVGRIAWTCGYANVEGDDPITGAAGPSRTDIDSNDLPSACRGGERSPSAASASPARPVGTSVAHAEAAREPPALGTAPSILFDIADSMAVTRQVLSMRRQQMQQQIQSGGRPGAPIFGRCTATIRIDDAGLPAPDFPIACSDPRVIGILRRAISTVGTPHAQPGSTVLLRVTAPFPPS